MQNKSKLKPNCGNCVYSYFKLEDISETERCKVLDRLDEVKINPLAKKLLESSDIRKKVVFCEYYQPTESLKNLIDYSLV